MYTKVVVPLDGSKVAEQILPYARLMAEVYKVPVELLRVEDPDARTPFWPSVAGMDYLTNIWAQRFPPYIRCDRIVERGHPAEIIVERAKLDPGCIIAIATHGFSGVHRWLLGSVASKVIQAASNPVLLVRASDPPETKETVTFRSIVVPLDGSEVAETVLPHGIDIAKAMDLEVVLVRAYQFPTSAYYRTDDYQEAEKYLPSYADLVAAWSQEARAYLDEKVRQLRDSGISNIRSLALEGPAPEKIVELAQDGESPLIAMCTHGHSGVKRWLLGSVTDKVVHHSQAPVLIIPAK